METPTEFLRKVARVSRLTSGTGLENIEFDMGGDPTVWFIRKHDRCAMFVSDIEGMEFDDLVDLVKKGMEGSRQRRIRDAKELKNFKL